MLNEYLMLTLLNHIHFAKGEKKEEEDEDVFIYYHVSITLVSIPCSPLIYIPTNVSLKNITLQILRKKKIASANI